MKRNYRFGEIYLFRQIDLFNKQIKKLGLKIEIKKGK